MTTVEQTLRVALEGLRHVTTEQHPVWLGVMAVLDYQIEQATQNVCATGLAEAESHHARGGLAHLRALRETLRAQRERALKLDK